MLYYNRGIVHTKNGNYDRAIDDFTHAAEKAPGFAEAYNNRAEAWVRLEKFDNAIKDHSKALEIDPDFLERTTRTSVDCPH